MGFGSEGTGKQFTKSAKYCRVDPETREENLQEQEAQKDQKEAGTRQELGHENAGEKLSSTYT